MHGKRTFAQAIREKTRKPNRTATNTPAITTTRVSVGAWILEETDDGHLQIRHGETGETTILVNKE